MGNPWGGGSHVVYFRNDSRARNCNIVLAMGKPAAVGFRSINEVLGHREILGALQGYGYVNMSQATHT